MLTMISFRASHSPCSRVRTLLNASILVTMLASTITVSAGETFGLGSQSIFIAAMQFRPTGNNAGDGRCELQNIGYFYYGPLAGCPLPANSTTMVWTAPLELPEGAWIDSANVYYRNTSTASGLWMDSSILRIDSVQGFTTTNPTVNSIAYGNSSYGGNTPITAVGYNAMSLTSFTGDRTIDSFRGGKQRSYAVTVQIPGSGFSFVSFKGMSVTYHRQIAPAPATASFTDIPSSHPFFNEVEQLKKSGITLGCGNGQYCPDSPVTRGQMAAFLSRALGLQWDSATDAP